MDGRPKVGATRDRAVARVVRAPGVEATDPALSVTRRGIFPWVLRCECVRVCVRVV